MRLRSVALLVCAVGLGGCHLWHRTKEDCHKPQEYQRAVQVAPLQVPAGLDSANTQGALVIPSVQVTETPRGPKDPCLDMPPKYQSAPTTRPGRTPPG